MPESPFSFKQKPIKLLPFFMIYFIATVVITVLSVIELQALITTTDLENFDMQNLQKLSLASLVQGVIGLVFGAMLYQYIIEGLSIKERELTYKGQLPLFLLSTVILFLLSQYTYGLLLPWFFRAIIRFFGQFTELDKEKIQFASSPFQLLMMMISTLIMPVILFTLFYSSILTFLKVETISPIIDSTVMTVIISGCLGMFSFFFIRWLINFRWKNHSITLVSYPKEGVLLFLREFVLSAITLGIYAPAALLKLIDYLCRHIRITSQEKGNLGFNFDHQLKEDWLFIIKQMLLTLITAGIYFFWAFTKCTSHLLPKFSIVSREFTPINTTENQEI